MLKSPKHTKRWPGSPLRLSAGLLFWLSLFSVLPIAGSAIDAGPPAPDAGAKLVLSTGSTVSGEPIQYPTGGSALITTVEITLQPGQQTGWHKHPVPLVGYILEGELTVDYGAEGHRTFLKGDGLIEVMNAAHNGHNTGQVPTRILAVFIGMEGEQNTQLASPPGSMHRDTER